MTGDTPIPFETHGALKALFSSLSGELQCRRTGRDCTGVEMEVLDVTGEFIVGVVPSLWAS